MLDQETKPTTMLLRKLLFHCFII